MARSRNIKPAFFVNDKLAEIQPLGRLLFIALWTIADRDGRLEDRPKRIKAEALPYDDVYVDELLDDLQQRGFIARYAAGELRLIQVVKFAKHQNPHKKERASMIPAPDEHGASTVQAREDPELAGLIPDSGFLNPDCSTSDLVPSASPSVAAEHSPSPDSPAGLLAYLNERTCKAFRPVDANLRLVKALLVATSAKEVRAVIDAKVAEWRRDDKMVQYLRPATLFRRTNFEQYLGELNSHHDRSPGEEWRGDPMFRGVQ